MDVSKILFKQQLHCSSFSAIFLHHSGPKEYQDSNHRELNIHTCESTAYERLRQYGLCDRGIIPQYYGTIENLDPKLYQPHLNDFLEDEYPPKAILLEYIPNMQMLYWTNYTKKRMDNFIKGLQKIHEALVEHSDVYPRNMMIVEGDPERAIWIDFDRAQTFDPDNVTEKQNEWIEFEKELVADIGACMEADSLEGRLNKTYLMCHSCGGA